MTSGLISSPSLLGKKRLGYNDSDDVAMSVDNKHHKRIKSQQLTEENNFFHKSGNSDAKGKSPLSTIHPNKVRRATEHGNHSPISLFHNNSNDCSSSWVSSDNNQHSSHDYTPQMQKYHDSILLSMKTQFDLQMDKKNQECSALLTSVQNLTEENSKLRAHLQEVTKEAGDHNTKRRINDLENENRILKRAVAIQDSRQKEGQQQCEQLQAVLRSAAEHIAQLERANRQLLSELQSRDCNTSTVVSDFFPPQPPPDVF